MIELYNEMDIYCARRLGITPEEYVQKIETFYKEHSELKADIIILALLEMEDYNFTEKKRVQILRLLNYNNQ